jgi:hypothetical protein
MPATHPPGDFVAIAKGNLPSDCKIIPSFAGGYGGQADLPMLDESTELRRTKHAPTLVFHPLPPSACLHKQTEGAKRGGRQAPSFAKSYGGQAKGLNHENALAKKLVFFLSLTIYCHDRAGRHRDF